MSKLVSFRLTVPRFGNGQQDGQGPRDAPDALVFGEVARGGTTVAQYESAGQHANKAVTMALKRAQVDAVLRCAGLPQWLTQDLEVL
jgi:hypothetical protein